MVGDVKKNGVDTQYIVHMCGIWSTERGRRSLSIRKIQAGGKDISEIM